MAEVEAPGRRSSRSARGWACCLSCRTPCPPVRRHFAGLPSAARAFGGRTQRDQGIVIFTSSSSASSSEAQTTASKPGRECRSRDGTSSQSRYVQDDAPVERAAKPALGHN